MPIQLIAAPLKADSLFIFIKSILLCLTIVLFMPAQTYAQDNLSAESLLLESTKEQYKLDNEIRDQQWNTLYLKWVQTLTNVEKFINSDEQHNQEDINKWRDRINSLLENTKNMIKDTQSTLHTNKLLIDGLGKAPVSGEEPANLALTRKQLNYIQSFTTGQLEKITQLSNNVENIKLALSKIRRRQLSDILRTRLDSPFLPSSISSTIKTFTATFSEFFIGVNAWLVKHAQSKKMWSAATILLVVSLIAISLGQFTTRHFGRNFETQNPSHSRKLIAAISEGIAKGLLPATIILAIYFLLSTVYTSDSDKFLSTIKVILLHLLVLSIAISLCIAVLSPGQPQWRLTSLNASTSSMLGKGLIYLLTVLVLDSLFYSFMNFNASIAFSLSPEQSQTISFTGVIFNFLEAGGLLYLCRNSIWETATNNDVEAESSTLMTLWKLIRALIILAAITSIIASSLGYIFFASYINFGIFITALLFSIGYMTRHAVRETLSFIINQKWLRKNLGLGITTLKKIKFWANLIIDPLIFGTALLILLPFWGFPLEKVFQMLEKAFNGFSIGQLNISLKGVLLSMIVFFTIIKLMRFIQSFLKQNIFPNSQMDIISQHNTLTIINYIGVILAIGASIAALGIDLKTIALVMGALSVGIGFGLRNVISNYISGILLFLEKPIKMGDWIQVGIHEGIVKNVNFRATELETFQQASVIIPNADLISQPVINMTFVDKKGRIEIPISVAYKTDPVIVHNLLFDIAVNHPQVLEDPEPKVMLMSFGESSLDFELRCFTNDIVRKIDIASELRFQIERKLKDNAIEIPFPQRVVHIQNKIVDGSD